MPQTLRCQKEAFQLSEDITYLNCAYMSPLLKRVEEAGIEGMRLKRSPQIVQPNDFFETGHQLRKAFAQLVNIQNPMQVCSIPSVSYGLGVVAQNLRLSKGDNIIVLSEQFPSNYYAWERVARSQGAEIRIVSAPEVNTDRGKLWNEGILEAIDTRTKMVSLAHVHWVDGTKFDLAAIRQRSREVGALMVIDGTQSVGALAFDVQKIQPDALVCAGYKWLMGPYSLGLAYYGERLLEGQPLEESWMTRFGSENFSAQVNYRSQYQPGAIRYEVGESSNFVLLPMLLESIRTLNEWTPARIQAYCEELVKAPITQLKSLGFSIENSAYRGAHLWGVRLPEHLDITALKRQLDTAQVFVSIRGNAVRVSPHLYNTAADLDRLVACMENLLVGKSER